MADLTQIIIFDRLLTVDNNNYPVQQIVQHSGGIQPSQKPNGDRFPSHTYQTARRLSDVTISQGTSLTIH